MTDPTEIVSMDSDEWYPVYSVRADNKYGVKAEVSAVSLKRWRDALAAFEAVQKEMAEVFEVAQERQQREAAVAKAEKAVADAQAKLDVLRTDV